ncbi:hypothetical protein [Anabaena catenula]|uniref:Uncharacterized protein n=1 Tax=Anabaena catenula FACHB-362 TaxID=2692877 RepID=A0ABR8JA73_9NOST|nr:hypothetical protein [Anabaena catenula]MBD2695125.1 hypothetical protein [Anabaena catenula FACHB-362]
MYSENLIQTIKNSQSLLQASLNQGWQEFQQTETFGITKQLSEQMNWWYDSQYYNIIPNPAHWYASQLAGKYFLIEIGKLGIYLDTVFPGNFSQSEELVREDGLDVRIFRFKVFHQTQPICIFQLEFIHDHEKFYFIYPPQLEIFEL